MPIDPKNLASAAVTDIPVRFSEADSMLYALGVGLGLAIVKHVLGRHEAELAIESEPGVGSVFTCHFPPQRVVVDPPIPLAGGGQN